MFEKVSYVGQIKLLAEMVLSLVKCSDQGHSNRSKSRDFVYIVATES